MFIYVTAQILRTFYFSFPLLKRGPPLYSVVLISLAFVFFNRMKEGCDYSLAEIFKSSFSIPTIGP